MAERERVEDLGRLSEALHRLLDSEAFEHVGCRYYSKDTFTSHYKDEDALENLENALEQLKHELSECWCLARFGDDEDGTK